MTELDFLRALLKHSLLNVRRAAFGPEIGVRYNESIRSDIAGELHKMEQQIALRIHELTRERPDPDETPFERPKMEQRQ